MRVYVSKRRHGGVSPLRRVPVRACGRVRPAQNLLWLPLAPRPVPTR
ncbi:hypothetical protein BRPE64_BCDS01530 [Caballeronia insecticola]|uniref:Uncharacterized protein n=1 Tax=Caballeronia insecticola TaxID=758793 RepID=R4WK65_9BURK|nr:hypothetical protein BRPE64_BCDS01530 [Caballeronia insecticola]